MKLAYAVVTTQENEVMGVSIFDSSEKAIACMQELYQECDDHDDTVEEMLQNNCFSCDHGDYTCHIWERPLNNEGTHCHG